MDQYGDAQELRRDGAAEALSYLLTSKAEFLDGLRDDPQATLWNHGFALSPREVAEVADLINETQDLSHQEIVDYIEGADSGERRRIWPW